MPANDIALSEPFSTGDTCTYCGTPVVEVFRGVIHRRLLYHSWCWLQTQTSVAERPEPVSQPA